MTPARSSGATRSGSSAGKRWTRKQRVCGQSPLLHLPPKERGRERGRMGQGLEIVVDLCLRCAHRMGRDWSCLARLLVKDDVIWTSRRQPGVLCSVLKYYLGTWAASPWATLGHRIPERTRKERMGCANARKSQSGQMLVRFRISCQGLMRLQGSQASRQAAVVQALYLDSGTGSVTSRWIDKLETLPCGWLRGCLATLDLIYPHSSHPESRRRLSLCCARPCLVNLSGLSWGPKFIGLAATLEPT